MVLCCEQYLKTAITRVLCRTRQSLGGRVQEYFRLILYLFKFIFKATQRGENIHLEVEGAGAGQSFFKITILVEKNEIWLTSLP